jgi:hypothetical protein
MKLLDKKGKVCYNFGPQTVAGFKAARGVKEI